MSGWTSVLLGSAAQVFNGKTPSKTEQREAGHPVLKIRDVSELGKFRGPFQSFVDESLAERYASKRVQQGDTLILNAAHNADYVGSKTFHAELAAYGALATGEWLIVRPDPETLDAGFVHHWVRLDSTRREIKEVVNGIHLYPKDVARLKVPLPPLPEQRHIAAILDQADALRAKRREALAQLDSLMRSIFIEMFGTASTDQLEWPKLSLAEVADVLTGYAFKSDEFVDLGKSTVRLCRGTNVMPGRVDWQDLACWPKAGLETLSSFVLEAGDIVMAMDRPWISEGFKIARIAQSDCPALLVQRVARVRARENALNDFLYGLLLQPAFAQHCRPTETTIPHISPKEIRSFELRLPPLALQETFATRIRAVEALKATHHAALTELEALFASLQHRAFAGQLS